MLIIMDSATDKEATKSNLKENNNDTTTTTTIATTTTTTASSIIIPTTKNNTPQRTVYMDGVFDLFHIGHLEAIKHCAKLGNKVIIGITGDTDATGYKRCPIINQVERIAIISSLKQVDDIVCPCPLIVTEEFMAELGIDLVVHGFANDEDVIRQKEFFDIPMKLNKFQRIPYYFGQSTTNIIQKVKSIPDDEIE